MSERGEQIVESDLIYPAEPGQEFWDYWQMIEDLGLETEPRFNRIHHAIGSRCCGGPYDEEFGLEAALLLKNFLTRFGSYPAFRLLTYLRAQLDRQSTGRSLRNK